jgi:hypothetical protein
MMEKEAPATHCRTCSNALSADEQECAAEDCDACWDAQGISRHVEYAAAFRGWLHFAATEAARGNGVYPARVAEHDLRYAYNAIEMCLRDQDVVRAEVALHLASETARQRALRAALEGGAA